MAGDLSGRIDRVRQAMAARVAAGELPGIVYLVADGDEAHVEATGAMQLGATALGAAEPMRRDAIFRIASLTKPILAAATMMLVEDGTLRLDEPIDRLLPELADRRVLRRVDGPLDDTVPADRSTTVEDLLTFRMGFGQPLDPPYPVLAAAKELHLELGAPNPRTPHEPDEWIKLFGMLPLMYQPGQRWQYNAGALVLGVLVARAAAQPLGDVLRSRLFEPLGMADTGFWLPAEKAARLPACYATNRETGHLELLPYSAAQEWIRPPAFPSGAGGLLSTVDDYLAFARLLLHKGMHNGRRLLTEESVTLMTTNRLTSEQMANGGPILGGNGWGYGMAVVATPGGDSPLGSYGWVGGHGTFWFNDPGRGLIAIALTQTTDFLFSDGAAEFTRLAFA